MIVLNHWFVPSTSVQFLHPSAFQLQQNSLCDMSNLCKPTATARFPSGPEPQKLSPGVHLTEPVKRFYRWFFIRPAVLAPVVVGMFRDLPQPRCLP
jgi:hypothetical protein